VGLFARANQGQRRRRLGCNEGQQREGKAGTLTRGRPAQQDQATLLAPEGLT
jgi:hypothetical protein